MRQTDGASDGRSGQELASVRSLARSGGGGGLEGQKEKSVVYLDKLISLF